MIANAVLKVTSYLSVFRLFSSTISGDDCAHYLAPPSSGSILLGANSFTVTLRSLHQNVANGLQWLPTPLP